MNRRYGYRYIYYHCTRKRPCTQRVIEARALEAQIATYLARLAVPPRVLDWAYERLEDVEAEDQSSREAVEQSLHTTVAASKKELAHSDPAPDTQPDHR